MKYAVFTTVGIFVGLGIGAKLFDQSDRIQQLQIENAFLKDYKRCYFNHLEKCDTMHIKCFKIK